MNDTKENLYRLNHLVDFIKTLPYNEQRPIIKYIVSEGGLPQYKGYNYYMFTFEYNYATIEKDNDAPNPLLIKIINSLKEAAQSTEPVEPQYTPRKTVATCEEILCVKLYYNAMINLSPGDHWSCISPIQNSKLIKNGFNIECCGSPFNTRLQYFGSIYAGDEPWGALGTCESILDNLINRRPVMWRTKIVVGSDDPVRITISPPANIDFMLKIIDLLVKLFTARRDTKVYLDVSGRHKYFIALINMKFIIESQSVVNKTWSLWDGKMHDMKGRIWMSYMLIGIH